MANRRWRGWEAGIGCSECSQDQTDGDSGEHDHGNSARLMDLELDPQAMDQSDSDLDVDAWMTEGLDEEESNDNAVAEEEQGVAQEEGEESDAVASAEQADGSVRAMGRSVVGEIRSLKSDSISKNKSKRRRKQLRRRDKRNKRTGSPRYRVSTGKDNKKVNRPFSINRQDAQVNILDGGGSIIGVIKKHTNKKFVKVNRGIFKEINGEMCAYAHGVANVLLTAKGKLKRERKGSTAGWIALRQFNVKKDYADLARESRNKSIRHKKDSGYEEGAKFTFDSAPRSDAYKNKSLDKYKLKVVKGSKRQNEQVGDYMLRNDNTVVLSQATPGHGAIAADRFSIGKGYIFVQDKSVASDHCNTYKKGQDQPESYVAKFIYGQVMKPSAATAMQSTPTTQETPTDQLESLGFGFMLYDSLTKLK